jgi:hypothetical protein
MADRNRVQDIPPEEILWELRRREAAGNLAELGVGLKATVGLEGLETEDLVDELLNKQKVIYGVDDRQDLFSVQDPAVQQDADGVVALFDAGDVVDNGDGTSTLQTTNYGTTYSLCAPSLPGLSALVSW